MKTELIAILSLAAVLAITGGADGKRCGSGACLLTPETMARLENGDVAHREMAEPKIETAVTQRSMAPQSATPTSSR
ncbi:MAG TPA: hypothetical protein VFD27_06305 [Chthoniobacteraceae bacterium]|jgi:hypothetical protein|nr:hypothetical protein [Chthoniobacteraceae bacterium]